MNSPETKARRRFLSFAATAMGRLPKISIGFVVAFSLWFAVVSGGTIWMIDYSNTPASNGQPPVDWPKNSAIPLDAKLPTLVMFVHPQCPCSRASLGELDALLARCAGRVSAHVVFLKPAGTVTNWEKSDLWAMASNMPGVKVHRDDGGAEARRFRAETSGQTLLYDPKGTLQFQGGITLSRGHAGDNPGRSALEQFVLNGHSSLRKTPVFGCSLFEDQCQKDAVCKQ